MIENIQKDKLVFRFIMMLSVLVFVAVVILNKNILPVPSVIPSFAFQLPKLNAYINATCSVLLILSFIQIKKKNIETHKKINIFAFILSSLFLISYILYHWLVPETKFGGAGMVKGVYYFILISHIILAAIVLPLILLSFYRGLTSKIELHKKIVRWSFPIWLYVTVTGVIVYLMISPYYNFS